MKHSYLKGSILRHALIRLGIRVHVAVDQPGMTSIPSQQAPQPLDAVPAGSSRSEHLRHYMSALTRCNRSPSLSRPRTDSSRCFALSHFGNTVARYSYIAIRDDRAFVVHGHYEGVLN